MLILFFKGKYGGTDILNKDRILVLNKLIYYNSTVGLIRQISIVFLILLGAILIFRNSLELTIHEYYIKSVTVSLWICVIGCGLTYYILISHYKKSLKMFGLEEANEPESVKRARIFGSTRSEYLSIIVSTGMVAVGTWFGIIFILLGLLNP